jgi:hypothetical protein
MATDRLSKANFMSAMIPCDITLKTDARIGIAMAGIAVNYKCRFPPCGLASGGSRCLAIIIEIAIEIVKLASVEETFAIVRRVNVVGGEAVDQLTCEFVDQGIDFAAHRSLSKSLVYAMGMVAWQWVTPVRLGYGYCDLRGYAPKYSAG